jgi:hypothetical protein
MPCVAIKLGETLSNLKSFKFVLVYDSLKNIKFVGYVPFKVIRLRYNAEQIRDLK